MPTGILYPTSGKASVLDLTPWQQRRKLAFRIAHVYGQKSQIWYHLPQQDTFDLLARIYELDMAEYRKRRGFLVEVFDIADHMRTPVRIAGMIGFTLLFVSVAVGVFELGLKRYESGNLLEMQN
jgi:ABC-2 type transport system ATP-binding protein